MGYFLYSVLAFRFIVFIINNLNEIKMTKKFFIKEELMCGIKYYMIYKRVLFFWESFYERWNTIETAEARLTELLN